MPLCGTQGDENETSIHSEVFGGFSGAACGGRIADSGSRILVTMDGYYRNGELIDHKAKADSAQSMNVNGSSS
jgi:acyl-coenzyme A synthetase/AMP-(fatty) acid ligase